MDIVAIIMVIVPHLHQTIVSRSPHRYDSLAACAQHELGEQSERERRARLRYGVRTRVRFECTRFAP
jgi:hypothetical protein